MKSLTFNEALLELNREKHPQLVAVEKSKGHIMTWNHGVINRSFGVDAIPDSTWNIIDQRKTLPEIFSIFKEGKGFFTVVYTNLKGNEILFKYGSEDLIKFNLLMQKRWELRISQPHATLSGRFTNTKGE